MRGRMLASFTLCVSLALFFGGCAAKGGYQLPTQVESAKVFTVGEYFVFDWGFRIELLRVTAIRSDGWLEVEEARTGTWLINPDQALGVQHVTRLPSAPTTNLQAEQ